MKRAKNVKEYMLGTISHAFQFDSLVKGYKNCTVLDWQPSSWCLYKKLHRICNEQSDQVLPSVRSYSCLVIKKVKFQSKLWFLLKYLIILRSIYILLDVLMYSITEYFYKLFVSCIVFFVLYVVFCVVCFTLYYILTRPECSSNTAQLVKILSNTTLQKC